MIAVLSTRDLYRIFLHQCQWWRELSSEIRHRVGKCQRCGRTEDLQCHHKVYRESWFDTKEEDLEVLCGACHKREHGIWVKEERLVERRRRRRKRVYKDGTYRSEMRKLLGQRGLRRISRAEFLRKREELKALRLLKRHPNKLKMVFSDKGFVLQRK